MSLVFIIVIGASYFIVFREVAEAQRGLPEEARRRIQETS